MNLSEINVSTLIVNSYENKESYSCDYLGRPRPFHSFALMTSGRGALYFRDKRIEIKEGDAFFIPQHAEYRSEWFSDNEKKIVYTSLHFSFYGVTGDFSERFYPVQKITPPDFDALAQDFYELQRSLADGRTPYLSASLFFLIMHLLLPRFTYETNLLNVRIRPALVFLNQNYKAKTTVKTLSDLCCLSEPRFYALFKKSTGLSPVNYKNSLLLENAANYLSAHPEKSVEQISDDFGFSSPVYFTRLFRSRFGVTPSGYRKDKRNTIL